MKRKLSIMIMLAILFLISGCGKTNQNGHDTEIDMKELNQSNINYDIDEFLANQKIVFIMSISSYAEPYAAGYFIDTTGKKHIYELYERRPFESIEEEYTYLLEHYDEFEIVDFFENSTLKKCTEYLYHVNSNSELKTDGEVIMDYPEKQLYGIRIIDECEEFVFLGSDTGVLKSVDDSSVDQIFEEFGDKWYLLR